MAYPQQRINNTVNNFCGGGLAASSGQQIFFLHFCWSAPHTNYQVEEAERFTESNPKWLRSSDPFIFMTFNLLLQDSCMNGAIPYFLVLQVVIYPFWSCDIFYYTRVRPQCDYSILGRRGVYVILLCDSQFCVLPHKLYAWTTMAQHPLIAQIWTFRKLRFHDLLCNLRSLFKKIVRRLTKFQQIQV